ncbi:MAG: phosphohistidine phosphatase SixA [Chloroflexi bacterium]|nr:phosphohistidine phosphatase SixA [Chloroflexota bacterium]
MKLYLMRHGPAGERGDWPNDFERPLTAEGKAETTQVAAGLKRLKVKPGIILTSPLTRARQTAELVADALTPGVGPTTCDALASGATPGELLKALRAYDGDVLIAGHDPDFSALFTYLLTGETRPFVDFSKSGVGAFDFGDRPERAAGTLLWYLRRRQLALLGGGH